ncbi:YjcZ family sporulation protein [Bacillus sp. FJAT-49870]|uniref:YjcZ family sporulation protein n=1 Tax=Lederbergia citri TaxID=2833580 RepID=A0A942YEK4_9BACI|nr:YjcZ family sporulation protein [Lederbergia citri]
MWRAYDIAKEKKEVINMGFGAYSGFAFVIVLFILLVIVGVAYI